ncbi:MAG: cell division protein FtsZ [Alphaproteobacteria bacterium]
MTITFSTPEQDTQLKPRITVIGVGGAGGNAVNNMIEKQLGGVDFVVANTDAQSLAQSQTERRIQLGRTITHGLGAGARPDMGRAAAEEAIDDIAQHLQGSHMVFIASGMGGGTGTGAAPVVARMAREQGMLTVGVVTKPFQFEGTNRMRIADAGIEEMQQFVDTLIVIPNQNLFRIANEKTTFADAFAMADDVLHCGVRGVTDLMVVPGLINLDFADIRSVMSEMGKAMMGTGESDGEERARLAAEAAISNPLLDDVSMRGARGVLINITGGPDMTLFEVDEAANRIGEEVDSEANIIFGSALDPSLEGRIRVSVVATGIDVDASVQPRPVLKVYSSDAVATGTHGGSHTPAEYRNGAETQPIEARAPALAPVAEVPAPIPEPPAIIELPSEEVPADTAPETATAQPIEIDEPFIPPIPVEAPKPVVAMPQAAAPTTPFRGDAAMVNPAPATEKKRGPNLFQRMTGAAWTRRDEPEPGINPVTTPEAPQPAPKPAQSPLSTALPETAQPTLLGVDRQDQPAASQTEEDLLDIPAFLRRQAN